MHGANKQFRVTDFILDLENLKQYNQTNTNLNS